MTRAIIQPLLALLLIGSGVAQGYRPPEFDKPAFDVKKIGLMEVERQKFATSLASFVVNEIKVADNANQADKGRRLLGLALHLDQRNRVALVANHQFKRGLAPKKASADYTKEALAKLFIAQSELLAKAGGDDNLYLSGLLLAAAVEMDPKNEDAVFALELYKLDVAEIDWEPITDGKPRKPAVPSTAGAAKE